MGLKKYCFACGKPLEKRYPGGDPENVPLENRCPIGHPTILEYCDTNYGTMFLLEGLDEIVYPSTPEEEAPPDVVEAAKRVMKWIEEEQ